MWRPRALGSIRLRCGLVAIVALALLSGVAVAAAAAPTPGFAYARVASRSLSTGEGPLLVGDRVLIGGTRRGRAVVRVHGLDGAARQLLRVPHARRAVIEMAASDQAIAVITGTVVARAARRVPAAFGPLVGPLRAFPSTPSEVGVAGSLVVTFDYDAPDRVVVRDVNALDAPPREIVIPEATLFTGVAGNYLAVISGRSPRLQIVVFDLLSGGEVYRVPARRLQDEALAPDGRVVLLERAAGGSRIVTATPAEPARREVAQVKVSAPRLAAAESGVAVVRRSPGRLAQIVIVGYDGSQRPVTPALNGINELDYDGRRLAFTAGRCVFAGPVPRGRRAARRANRAS